MVDRRDCEICCGTGRIRLPVYRRLTAVPPKIEDAVTLDEVSRFYPFPECSDLVPLERVETITWHTHLDSRIESPDFERHARGTLAAQLVGKLSERQLIAFEEGHSNPHSLRKALVASVNALSPRQAATIEERIARRQYDVARLVADRARILIGEWAPGALTKEVAKREIDRALGHVQAQARADLVVLRSQLTTGD